jgi:hypothetical protein
MKVLEVSELPEASAANTVLPKLSSFPVLLGAMLVAAACGSVWLKVQIVQSASGLSRSPVPIFEGDTWYDILAGEDLLRTHVWPTSESYSFTIQGNGSISYQWLAQVLWALTDHLGGLRALAGLLMALVALLMLLLYYYAYLRCGNCKAAFLACLVLLPLITPFITLRPQLLGYVFLLITMICLERFREGHARALWPLPLLFLLWVNIHGSFVLGLFVLGVYWASGLVGFRHGSLEAIRWTPGQRLQLAKIALFSVIALTITPYGTRLAAYPLQLVSASPLGIARITEYQPLGAFGDLLKLFLALLLLFVLAQAVLGPAYRLEELVLLLVAIYGAFVHLRLLLFFVLVFAPLLATLLARWVPTYERTKDRYLLNAVLIGLAALALAKIFPSQADLESVVAGAFPRGAVEYLKRHPFRGRMFNDDFWGGYLIRSLGREHEIFIDGRSQLYEEAGVFSDYLRIGDLDRDTPLLLRKYGVEACLIRSGSPLATYLSVSPDWELMFSDDVSSLFLIKRSGRPPARS